MPQSAEAEILRTELLGAVLQLKDCSGCHVGNVW